MHQAMLPVGDARTDLGESPLWCPRERALWWIDITQPRLLKWESTTGATREWKLTKPPACLALLEAEGVLVVFRNAVAVLEPGHGMQPRWLQVDALPLQEDRFNDGRLDSAGRLWVGSMDRKLAQPVGKLRCLAPDLALTDRDAGFLLSNGIAFSPDDRWLYFAETGSARIYRYAFDLATGSLGDRTVLVQCAPGAGGPDGLTVDAEGALWVAMFDRGCLHRYSADGQLLRSIELPVRRPTSCALGGEDGRTLLVTTAMHGLSALELGQQPQAGQLLTLRVDVPGRAEARFKTPRIAEAA